MMLKKYLSGFLILIVFTASSQVKINEVCSRNASVLYDEDNDNEDWLELYNAGASPVNLQGYFLSDDASQLDKWSLPNFTIQPAFFITIFASGKDRKQTVNHWETVVYAEDTWKYIVPSSEVDSTWNQVSFNDGSWLSGAGGFGYGDGDDNTVIGSPATSVFIRKTFNIIDTSTIANAILNIDYDDGFIVYLNGVEIARENVGVTGSPSSFDEFAYNEHEALMYQGMLPAKYTIEEQFLKSALINGTNVLAIQVHNISATSSDLTIIPYLSLGIKNSSYNYGPTPAWFKMGASFMHTNFKFSADGETIFLTSPSMTIVDQLTFPYMQLDNSTGRQPDGTGNLVLFGTPTPDSTNNGSTAYNSYIPNPDFSINAGFYSSPQTLTIANSYPGALIKYTLDGSIPTDTAFTYTGPIGIDTTTVVRARVFSASALPSEIITNTYFIDFESDLSVISISTNPDNLWDWETGIYVMGPNADSVIPYFGANFWQDWEIPIHMEFFDHNKIQQFEQDFGCKINGGWSRSNDLKSLRILAKSKYGKSNLDYQLFSDKEIYSFKRFVLRNSGNECNITHFRDALMHKNVYQKTFNDIQDYRPSVVFLDGQYWGVHNIREKISKYYIAENYGINPDSVDLLQFDGYVIEGSNENFLAMAEFIVFNDMTDSLNYDSVTHWLDIENFCDHFITETYYINWDWPQNNIKYWRERKPGARWRYILTDIDMGLGLMGSFTTNDLNRVINATNNYHSYLFRSLLENTTFRNYFTNRYADLINTIFEPGNFKELAYKFRDSIASEMPRHFAKWGGDVNFWSTVYIDGVMINFIENRPKHARNHIQDEFSLKKQVCVTLNVYPPEAGKIKISTITPESLPWSGIYFDSVPVTITAIPNLGFQFSFWESVNILQLPDFNPSMTINIDTNDVFTAYFFGTPQENLIAVNEINYNSSASLDAGDWVELYNYGNIDVDISCWKFKDSNDDNEFVFPENTVLTKGQYLILFRDSAKFKSQFPSVLNAVGPFDFGLSSSGDTLRLFDDENSLYLSMSYSPSPPWPDEANGQGYTLELLDANGNLNDASNWFTGCIGGSPGKAFEPCQQNVDDARFNNTVTLNSYPNPFDNHTCFLLHTSKNETVTINILDQFGRKVDVLLNKKLAEGNYEIYFDAGKIPAGVYYCQLITPSEVKTIAIQKIF